MDSAVLVHTPISMLQAWSTFLVVDSAFAAFGMKDNYPTPTINPAIASEVYAWIEVYAIIAILALELAAVVYAFASPEGDFVANVTITWVLYGLTRRGSFAPFETKCVALLSVVFVIKSAHGFYLHKYPVYRRQLFGGEVSLESAEDGRVL
ncbi:hypothetical protein FRB98_008613 [Tulasnella sp. 332]|nr:hypothetical protein FRB98_008613 [Tulasnella sp. 332]